MDKLIRQLPLIVAIILMISNCSGDDNAGDSGMLDNHTSSRGTPGAGSRSGGATVMEFIPIAENGTWTMVKKPVAIQTCVPGTKSAKELVDLLKSYYSDFTKTKVNAANQQTGQLFQQNQALQQHAAGMQQQVQQQGAMAQQQAQQQVQVVQQQAQAHIQQLQQQNQQLQQQVKSFMALAQQSGIEGAEGSDVQSVIAAIGQYLTEAQQNEDDLQEIAKAVGGEVDDELVETVKSRIEKVTENSSSTDEEGEDGNNQEEDREGQPSLEDYKEEREAIAKAIDGDVDEPLAEQVQKKLEEAQSSCEAPTEVSPPESGGVDVAELQSKLEEMTDKYEAERQKNEASGDATGDDESVASLQAQLEAMTDKYEAEKAKNAGGEGESRGDDSEALKEEIEKLKEENAALKEKAVGSSEVAMSTGGGASEEAPKVSAIGESSEESLENIKTKIEEKTKEKKEVSEKKEARLKEHEEGEKAKKEADELQPELDQKEKERKELEDKKAEEEQKHEEEQKKSVIEALAEQLSKKEEEKADLEEKKKVLLETHEKGKKSKEEADALGEKEEALDKEIKGLEEKRDALEAKDKESEALKSKVADLEGEKKDLEAKHKELQDKHEALEGEKKDLETKHAALQKEKQEGASAPTSSNSDELEKAKERVELLETQALSVQDKLKLVQDRYNILSQKVQEVQENKAGIDELEALVAKQLEAEHSDPAVHKVTVSDPESIRSTLDDLAPSEHHELLFLRQRIAALKSLVGCH